MAERQTRHGWSWNDSVLVGLNTIVPAPDAGRVRIVEIVRFRFTRTGTTTWWLQHNSVTVWGRALTSGSYEAKGPFVLDSGPLIAGPVIVTVTVGEFSAEWIER